VEGLTRIELDEPAELEFERLAEPTVAVGNLYGQRSIMLFGTRRNGKRTGIVLVSRQDIDRVIFALQMGRDEAFPE
jgi:RNase P/RNase MRP subunit POP5